MDNKILILSGRASFELIQKPQWQELQLLPQ
jgi:formate dehydrogenase assembly factor FdhD